MDKQVFAKGMAELGEAFHAIITELGLKIYFKYLADLDESQWQTAVARAVTELKQPRLPTVAQLLELAGAAPDPMASANDAWVRMLELRAISITVERFQRYDPENGTTYLWPGEPSELDRKLVPDWNRFCHEPINDFKRKDFIEAFRAYAKDPYYQKQLAAVNTKQLPKGEPE